MPYQAAFKSKVRVVDNPNKEGERPADQKIVADFTVPEAMKAAQWLVDSAKKAQAEGTTVRVYSGQNNYDEVPGFAMWGSLWGSSGNFSPKAVTAEDEEL